MSDPFRRVTPGEPVRLSARAWNAALESARAEQLRRMGTTGPGTVEPLTVQPTVSVLVRNDTGSAVPFGEVLALGSPIGSPTEYPRLAADRPAFSGGTPTSSSAAFGVLLHDAAPGEIVAAAVQGVAVAWIEDEVGDYAAPSAGNRTFATTIHGPARILWRGPPDEERTLAMVLLAGPPQGHSGTLRRTRRVFCQNGQIMEEAEIETWANGVLVSVRAATGEE
jgi:hypothetical protein